MTRGNVQEAVVQYSQALVEAKASTSLELELQAQRALAYATARTGDYRQARKRLEQALEQTQEAPAYRAPVLYELGISYILSEQSLRSTGSTGKAGGLFEKALDVCQSSDDRSGQAFIHYQLGWMALHSFRLDEADDYFKMAYNLLDDAGDARARNLVAARGLVEMDRGHLDRAKQMLERSLSYALRSGDRHFISEDLAHVGIICHLQEDLDGAEVAYRAALGHAMDIDQQNLTVMIKLGLGMLEAERGHLEEARRLFDPSLAYIEKSIYGVQYAGALAAEGVLLVARANELAKEGDKKQAKELRAKAVERLANLSRSGAPDRQHPEGSPSLMSRSLVPRFYHNIARKALGRMGLKKFTTQGNDLFVIQGDRPF